jgi:hypothetical protein
MKTRRTIVIIAIEDNAADRAVCKWDWNSIMRQVDAHVITTWVAAEAKPDATDDQICEAVRDAAAVAADSLD